LSSQDFGSSTIVLAKNGGHSDLTSWDFAVRKEDKPHPKATRIWLVGILVVQNWH